MQAKDNTNNTNITETQKNGNFPMVNKTSPSVNYDKK